MYYTPAETPSSFYDKAMNSQIPAKRVMKKRWLWLAVPGLAAILVIGSFGWRATLPKPSAVEPPQTLGQSSVSATPAPPISRTFGDLLKERPSFNGWLAGVDNGNIILVQPQNGSLNTLVTAKNSWYGPVSDLIWSPDHSKLAYLTLPDSDAAALTQDAAGYAKKAGLASIPTPASFPYGRITVIDVVSKQIYNSNLEIRNTPKSLLWLDGTSLAAIGQTIVRYEFIDDRVTTLIGGGNTNADEQLQSPLAWDASRQVLYFTKVRQQEDGQTVRLLATLSLKSNELKELQVLKSGAFADVTTSRGIDIALSSDGERLAQISDQGLSYVTLNDQAVHMLPYDDTRVWLQQSILSNIQWLSPDKIAFTSLAQDGTRVWAVWYIPTNDIGTIGKGSLSASWDVASGRLALIEPDGKTIGILTPNWSDTAKSQLQTLPLAWSQVSW